MVDTWASLLCATCLYACANHVVILLPGCAMPSTQRQHATSTNMPLSWRPLLTTLVYNIKQCISVVKIQLVTRHTHMTI